MDILTACRLLDPTNPREREEILSLQRNPITRVVDTIDSQLEEIFRIRHPETIRTGVDEKKLQEFQSEYADPMQFGMWGYYPWANMLIRFLPEEMHTELRTSRNRNLITSVEQEIFYHSKIGIAGLSVGNSVLGAILHTGGGKELRIADPDTMAGSNTNRIRVGFDTVGLPKTTIAEREIYLTNPYAEVRTYPGLTEETIDEFLTKPEKLSLVIDEMDDLYLKIRLRFHARKLGIPVVMAADNGDGAVIDIERFDLEPDRPLMHGDIPEEELLSIPKAIPRATAAKIISTWVGPANIAPRMMTSLMELGKTLYTWPQLGSAATLSGALLSYVVRAILTGLPIGQGKFTIQPEHLFDPESLLPAQQKKRKDIQSLFEKTMGISPE